MGQVWTFIKSDFHRYRPIGGNRVKDALAIVAYALTARWPGFTYAFWWRIASGHSPLRFLGRLMAWRLGKVYCIDLPPGTRVGHGLYLGHGMGLVVNRETVIGDNVNLSHFVSVGTNSSAPATIGDNVYVGPNVSVVEDVVIGNDVTIGAGSVVTRDLPDGCTAVGVPCKPVNFNAPGRYIVNRWPPRPGEAARPSGGSPRRR